MRLLKTGVCVVLIVTIGVAAGGCAVGPVSDLVSAGLKVANNQMSQLTGAEIKAMSDAAIALLNSQTGGTGQPLTTEQAAAVADFFAVNNINSPTDLEQLVHQAENDPGSVQGMDELAAAFGLDPNDPDPDAVKHVFEQLFGMSFDSPQGA
jgi:hypothetical protein